MGGHEKVGVKSHVSWLLYCQTLRKVSHLCYSVFLVNGEAKLDHTVDAGAEDVGVIQAEAGGEQGGVKEQQNELLDSLVTGVSLSTISQLLPEGLLPQYRTLSTIVSELDRNRLRGAPLIAKEGDVGCHNMQLCCTMPHSTAGHTLHSRTG